MTAGDDTFRIHALRCHLPGTVRMAALPTINALSAFLSRRLSGLRLWRRGQYRPLR